MNKLIGVLAIQGDFQAHVISLSAMGAHYVEIRNTQDLQGVTHLIVPGGESTTVRRVAQQDGLWEELAGFKGPVMGTCMGCILMADKILEPDARGWNMLDMTIRRNAYGRQINSFTSPGRVAFMDIEIEMVFIRAPKIVTFGSAVKPIAWLGDEITGVICGNKMALTFHPELSGNTGLHEYFLGL